MHSTISDEWGSFTAIPRQFIEAARRDQYSDQAFRLFVLLRDYTNGQSGLAFPSYNQLQLDTGWSPKTIAKALRELEKHGWMVRKKQFSGPTLYRLVRPSPQSFPMGSNGQVDSTSPREVLHFPQGSLTRQRRKD